MGKRRAILIVGLGTIALASVLFSLLRTGGVECLQHENTVILRGERVLNIRKDEARPPLPVMPEAYMQVQNSCSYLIAHCPLESGRETRRNADLHIFRRVLSRVMSSIRGFSNHTLSDSCGVIFHTGVSADERVCTS